MRGNHDKIEQRDGEPEKRTGESWEKGVKDERHDRKTS